MKAPSTSGIKLEVNSEFTIILSVFASPKVNFPDKVISSATIKLCDICKDPDILNLEQALQEKTGISTVIENRKNNSGLIKFEYKDLDQLNRLIEVVKINY